MTNNEDLVHLLYAAIVDVHRWTSCPVCPEDEPPFPVWTLIMHLNDDHSWTRECIADHLDTLEDMDLTFPEPES